MMRLCWEQTAETIALCIAMAIAGRAQTFTTLVNFDGTNGSPYTMTVVQGQDGNLYGTTEESVFKITPDGTFNTLFVFTCQNGECPAGIVLYDGLTLGTDGNFYGTASRGGNNSCLQGCGTVFKITPSGEVTVLHLFDGSDGSWPYSGLIQATDGSFYGTTYSGGTDNLGTIFRITPSGKFKTVHSFSLWVDGGYPQGGLLQASDGYIYGTTSFGGRDLCTAGCGTIFKMGPHGRITTLYEFCALKDCSDGIAPTASLIQGRDGALYGTTYGYDNNSDNPSEPTSGGTAFRITTAGALTTLYNFSSHPVAGLAQATDGNFYGTTLAGGDFTCDPYNGGCGTIFQITPKGELTTLHAFEYTDGEAPLGGLAQATTGAFYGSTAGGGTLKMGTLFSLDMGFGPFVAFVRDSGKVGATGGILGEGFTGTTSVLVNGTPATFSIVSDTFLQAQVPDGATTGLVTVNTPRGILTSNKAFRVLPQILNVYPHEGPIGTQVTIDGVSLTDTIAVGFGDRILAQFTVISDHEVIASVPNGGKTGPIGIKTKGGIVTFGEFVVTP